MQYINLHVHSLFSMQDSLVRIPELVQEAKKYDMPAVACTDHGTMAGILKFYKECKKQKIKGILGEEFYFCPDRLLKVPEAPMWHLILLAQNLEGYHNLLKLSSLANTEGFYRKPRIDRELLEKYNKGLICLSACFKGEIPQAILAGQTGGLQANWYSGLFEKRFYLEIQKHGINNEKFPDQEKINNGLWTLSREYNIFTAASCDIHYLHESDHGNHRILKALAYQSDNLESEYSSDTVWFRSPEEMDQHFRSTQEREAVGNTLAIADQIEDYDIGLGKVYMPEWKAKDPEKEFVRIAEAGLEKTYFKFYPDAIDIPQEYWDRLRYECEAIIKAGFASYFITLMEILHWLDENNIARGPGRGSCTGSLVAFALDITKVDSIKYNLLFERFINPVRVSRVDIDSDFDPRYKDKLLEYLVQRFGQEHIAQIGTFTKFKPKSCLRDLCRLKKYDRDLTERVIALVPEEKRGGQGENAITFEKIYALDTVRHALSQDSMVREVFEQAKFLEGLYRQGSAHASGIVISPSDVSDYIPVARIGSVKLPVTQWDMNDVEEVGLVKYDFLSLKNIAAIRKTTDLIKERHNKIIDVDVLPDEDIESYKLIHEGKTTGIFQMMEDGMTAFAAKFKPNNIKDLPMITALYRPGPMDSGWHTQVAAIRTGEEKASYPIPEVKDILEPTYGAMVYQEQIMAIARKMAGYSLGQADILRKACGKKKPEEMKQQEGSFIEGCLKNKFSQKVAKETFDAIEKFSNYGFCVGHATSYSLISYQTTYLKAHYPAEFLASCMTLEEETSEFPSWFTGCREMGITILPPHINYSENNFTVQDDKTIRFGLGAIKGLGADAIQRIITERSIKSFESLEDLINRVSTCNAKCLSVLIDSGAIDGLGLNRSQMRYLAEEIQKGSRKQKERIASGQLSFFEEPKMYVPTLPEDKETDLNLERETVGFYISGHPLDLYNIKGNHVLNLSINTKVIDGIVISVRELVMKKTQRKFATVILADKEATTEAVVWSEEYQQFRDYLVQGRVVRCTGYCKDRNGKLQFTVRVLIPFSEIRKRNCQAFVIPGAQYRKLKELKPYLGREGIPVVLDVRGLQMTIGHIADPELARKVFTVTGILALTIEGE